MDEIRVVCGRDPVAMGDDVTYGIGQEIYNGFPRTYCLEGKFNQDVATPVAARHESMGYPTRTI